MKRAAILAVLLLGLVAAADADPVVRGVLVAAVTIVVLRMTKGAAARMARRLAVFSVIPGAVLVALVWALILSDGDIAPGRIIAGLAIIYAASAGGALVLALMRNYEIVRR